MFTAVLCLIAAVLLRIAIALIRRHSERSGTPLRPRERPWPILEWLPTQLALVKPDPKSGIIPLQQWFVDTAAHNNFQTWSFSIPWFTQIVIHSPENCRHIMKTRFGTHYVLGEQRRQIFTTMLGNGIFNSDGERWKVTRSSSSHLFSARQLRSRMVAVFKQNAERVHGILEEHRAAGTEIDLQQLMYRYTFDSFMTIAFSQEVNSLGGDPNGIAVQTAFDKAQIVTNLRFTQGPLWQLKQFLNTGNERDMKEYMKVVNKFVLDGVRARCAEETTKESMDDADLLSMYMQGCETEGRNFTEQDLRDLIINFIIAGRDTTASAMTWALYELAQHPEARALAEQDVLAHDDVAEMHYLQAVFQESVRLHPPVPLDAKECIRDDVLPDGTKVKAGTVVCFHPVAFCRNPNLYPDPDSFLPSRWLDGEGKCKAYDEYAFPCFNAGPRLCLGRHMAALEAKIVLAEILSDLRLDLSAGFSPKVGLLIVTNSSNGMMMTVKDRPK